MRLGPITLLQRRVIGAEENPLLVRYILFRVSAIGVYLHHLCRSDYDRALHDHPWPFISVLLSGGYDEVHDQTIDGKVTVVPHRRGDVLVRPAEWRHRFVLPDGKKAWTLVIVGRRCRRWGFFLPTGWCWWRKHNSELAICEEEILWEGGSD
jgi:hypothetical protein